MPSKNIRKRRSLVKISFDLPVVLVNRSNKNITALLLEPITKRTLFQINSFKMEGTKVEKSTKVGHEVAQFLKSQNFEKVVFYRNGFIYTGRIAAVAGAIRENNIQI